ncbi:hypothetical protein [Haloarchaeobius litoreus]|uniref:t-SNARE coiled-coil homology domain-containing protein n=1 Tax=Haloarchaeobius litoreus TaxID=755306 RepID=A0ABD6DF63_9EURY|nr:hypothetical protein [Haloarchaeobius litoreus]
MHSTDSLSNTKSTTKDGIRVAKGIQPGDGAMTVKYRITSERSDTAAVRLEESLGRAFPVETLDLDATGHGDWLLEDGEGTLVLVDILPAGDTVTTGYVVATAELDRVQPVFGEPYIDMVDPVDSDGTRSRTGGNTTTVSDAELTEDAVADALTPEVVAAALSSEAVADVLSAEAVVSALPPDAVVEALIDAFETGTVGEQQAERLREHVAPGQARSEEVHFQHLEARLEEFAAYADGLGDLIDEHGTATEIVDDMQADIAAAREAVTAVEGRLDADAGEYDSLGHRLDAVDERLAGTAERLDTVDDRFDAVDERFAAVEGRFEAVENRIDDRVDAVADDVTTLDEGLDRTNARLDRVGGRTDEVDARADSLADDLAGVQSRIADIEERHGESMTELADHVAELEADLAATEEWREQLGEAFQGDPPLDAGTGGATTGGDEATDTASDEDEELTDDGSAGEAADSGK